MSRTKTIVATSVQRIKPYIKPTLYIIGGFFLLYIAIFILTRKEKMPAELQATIDSLAKTNQILVEHQEQLDSTIRVYQTEVSNIDIKVDHIKEKTIIIKEFYHEQSQAVNSYTPTQVDFFFKQRYNY